MQSQGQQVQASVDLPKGGLGFPLYIEEFMDKVMNWNKNSPDIIKQQRLYSVATVRHCCNLALARSGLAILL